MSRQDIISYLGSDWDRVQALIRRQLHSDVALLEQTNAHFLANAGKMLRPMVSLLIARAIGTPTRDSICYAAASELLHNATLFHDDVADGSAERRGQPTVSALFGASTAVLIGDYWLARAVDLVVDTQHRDDVIRKFAKTLTDLAEGEMLQLEKAASCDTTEEDYLRIIYSKTASLFEASALAAAISVDAPDAVREAAADFARNLGLAFQIKDDIFDYESSAEEVGKPVGIDLQEQKITQPLLCALESASAEEAAAVRKKVVDILDHPELAGEVKDFVLSRDGVAQARKKLDGYIGLALSSLETLPESQERNYLVELARFVGERTR